METLAVIGLVVAVVLGVLAVVSYVVQSVRAHVTITRLPEGRPLPAGESGLEPEPGAHSFTFSHSGVIGHPTTEQREVLERLQRGELTPEQAAEALGGHAHSFGTKLELGGRDQQHDELLDEAMSVPEEPSLPSLRLLGAALALLVGIAAIMWLAGGTTMREHLFTTAYTTVILGGLIGAVAGPKGFARALPSGVAMSRIAFRAALVTSAAVLAWGLLAIASDHWSGFFPGAVFILLGSGVLIVVLLGRLAVARTRSTMRLLRRRRE